MVTLVAEREEHAPAVEHLLEIAFGEARWHKTSQRLRDGQAPLAGLSLVALAGDALVGTVRLWPVLAGRRRALLLGPLAVDPARRDEGIGAALMDRGAAPRGGSGRGMRAAGRRRGVLQALRLPTGCDEGLWLPGPVDRKRFLARETEAACA